MYNTCIITVWRNAVDANNTYITVLRGRLDDIRDGIEERKKRVRTLLEEIASQEKQVGHILQLLEAEGEPPDLVEVQDLQPLSVADMAYEVLSRREDQEPIHYSQLAEEIMSEGKLIPGQNPAANLIAHLGRDGRFVRTGRGTYGLAEWGLKVAPSRKRRRSRRKTSK
jgi:hypothetical protein